MSGPLDGTREAADSPLCWIVTTRWKKLGASCSRKGVAWIWWSDMHPRVRVCRQHAKGRIPAQDEIKRRVRQGGHVWRGGSP